MEAFYIVAITLMFIFSIAGAWCSRMFNPGTYLIYAQTFASGAFIGISLLHFIPETINDFYMYKDDLSYPYYSLIILFVFAIFCILEIKASTQLENPRSNFHDVSDDSVKDFSVFLMHRFTAIPSMWMRIIVYTFLSFHAVVIGFAIVTTDTTKIYFTLILATVVEKFVESFTISLIARKGQSSLIIFWICIVLYSLITPASIIVFYISKIHNNPILNAISSSLSAGLFLFIGILLWRKTFLTPFDWQKRELAIVSVVFVCSLGIQSFTSIDFGKK